MTEKRLYRYSEKKYNDSLLALGNVRIGTLHDFRRTEHKAGIADGMEGKKEVVHHIDYFEMKPGPESVSSVHNRAIQTFGMSSQLGLGSIMEDCTFIKTFHDPDCFIHCTSFKLSRDVMREFENADSCVEIFDPAGFYKQLTYSLHKVIPVKHIAIQLVQYKTRDEVWNGKDFGLPATIIKEEKFSGQFEVRCIWQPMFEGPIKPTVLNDIALLRFCRNINI